MHAPCPMHLAPCTWPYTRCLICLSLCTSPRMWRGKPTVRCCGQAIRRGVDRVEAGPRRVFFGMLSLLGCLFRARWIDRLGCRVNWCLHAHALAHVMQTHMSCKHTCARETARRLTCQRRADARVRRQAHSLRPLWPPLVAGAPHRCLQARCLGGKGRRSTRRQRRRKVYSKLMQ